MSNNIDILKRSYKNLRTVTKVMNSGKVDTSNIDEIYELYYKLKVTDERLDLRYEEGKIYVLFKDILLEIAEDFGIIYTFFFSILNKEYKLKDMEDYEVLEVIEGKHSLVTDLSNVVIGNILETLDSRISKGRSLENEINLFNKALDEYQAVWDICYKGKEQNFDEIKRYFKEMSEEISETKIKVYYGNTVIDIINKRSSGKATIEPYIAIYEGGEEVYSDLYTRDLVDIVEFIEDKKIKPYKLRYS